MRYPHLAAHLFNVPLFLALDKALVFAQLLDEREAGEELLTEYRTAAAQHEEQMQAALPELRRSEASGLWLTEQGIAILPVIGTTMHRGSAMDSMSGMTSYGRIGRQLALANADDEVRGVLLEVDSPGGEVAGAFDLAAQIHSSAKPTYAYANELAASAGYLLASGARKVYAPNTGRVGSIGVLHMHRDVSGADAKRGHKHTVVFAGARKVDGNPHAPLSSEARAVMQANVDRAYDLFCGTIAEHRAISVEAVQETEAAMMSAGEAVDADLIDGVLSFSQSVQLMSDDLSAGAVDYFLGPTLTVAAATPSEGVTNMPNANEQTAAATQAELIAQARAAGAAEATAAADARCAAVATEAGRAAQVRVAAILASPEAEGRRVLAEHLAFTTQMTAEDAAALLAKAPKEVALGAANPLAAAMAGIHNPSVGLDAGGDGDEVATAVASILSAGKPKLKSVS